MNKYLASLALPFLLVAGCKSSADVPIDAPVLSVATPDFYAAPTKLPDLPGVMIRQAAQPDGLMMRGASEGIRILYSSTDGLSGAGRTAVSGAVYLPEGDAPEGGWPVLVWSHGTVGIADQCAPSQAGWADNHGGYISSWLEEGYAVLTSDYQGLGTAGTHPYMALRPMAFSNLDMLKAVREADMPVSDIVFIGGQSQGASAAIATAIHAADYAPEIDLSGLLVTGVPYFTEASLESVLSSADPDVWHPNVVLSLYALSMVELVDDGFALEDVVSDTAWPAVSKVYEQCVFDYFETTQRAGLTPRNIFDAPYDGAMKTAFRQMIYPTVALDIPIFVGTGERDSITPMPMQQAFVQQACVAGSAVRSKVYDGADHFEALSGSIPDAKAFVDDVLAGNTDISTCR